MSRIVFERERIGRSPISSRAIKAAGILFLVNAAIVVCFSSVSMSADAQRVGPGSFEGGIILGEPTGFSGKLWTGLNSAVDAGVAWSFGKGGHIHLHADYIIHNFDLFEISTGQMPLYFGVGGRVRFEGEDSRAGLRIVIGTEYIFEDAPVSLFFEVAPIMDVIPETSSDVNGGFGVRFIF